ncbi:M23 family metallopeptidase [Arsenicicoccus dermatophilus]|uniref:M23 family metallopeptidase n=1 Tax=Arsenicicoccus dermatophilus TaxID=1076331 RepID=UPI001F4C538F|nr:M23 family metallopeptidase [Arsenicicoccus dermatophilus]MCH8611810.1 M23 family metallopeptidase [Arsenicicoccus dermatophilus]
MRRTSHAVAAVAAAVLAIPAAAPPAEAAPGPAAGAWRCPVTSTTWRGVQRFWTSDRRCFTSPWYAGAHPVMIGFGCNPSPWYRKAAACRWRGGIHHGVDVDMPVGTPIHAGSGGVALVGPRTMGSAYGRNRLILRAGRTDVVLGHLSRLAVRNGQVVRNGQLLGLSGMSGVERADGPDLHVEVRPAGTTYTRAVDPGRVLRLAAR